MYKALYIGFVNFNYRSIENPSIKLFTLNLDIGGSKLSNFELEI